MKFTQSKVALVSALVAILLIGVFSLALDSYINWRRFKADYDCAFNFNEYSTDEDKDTGYSPRDKFLIKCSMYKGGASLWEKNVFQIVTKKASKK